MGNRSQKKPKKMYRRKIRIRRANPDIPDSYICEIFDSSLDDEDEDDFNNYIKPSNIVELNENDKEITKNCKPKDYFEILMSRDSKKNINSKVVKEIKEVTELKDSNQDKETSNVKTEEQQDNEKHKLKAKESKWNECESFSSDDESLFEIRKKYTVVNTSVKEFNNSSYEKNSDIKNEVADKLISSSKFHSSPKKKSLNILNYFGKTGSVSQNKIHKAKSVEIEEIQIIKDSPNKNIILNNNQDKQFIEVKKKKNSTLSGMNKENVKLAPLFVKKEKKVVDVATQKARLEFLYNGAPTISKKVTNKVSEVGMIFQSSPHVQQKTDSVYWSLRQISMPLPQNNFTEDYKFDNEKKFKYNICQLQSFKNKFFYNKIKINENCFKNVKSKYVNLNLESIIDGLKEKSDAFFSRSEEVEKKYKVTNDESGFEVLNALWTEKYKPKSSEILGNTETVTKLRKWLQSWKTFDEELKSLLKSGQKMNTKRDCEDDDSDAFLQSDDEMYGLKSPGNVCLLSGPNGCGKTALIFALANELEFSVLEVNASSKRTGKKVLSDLQEATQSHKVQRVNVSQNEKVVKETKKRSIRGKRRKKKKISELDKSLNQMSDCKISLILIEDADIVFEEHDEGFISALTSLVQTSKRPLIFLTNDSNSSHLENFKTEQSLILEMKHPNFYESCAVLDVVTSLEGVAPFEKLSGFLLRHNHFDIRKTLLELQFWTKTETNSLLDFQQPVDLGKFWWGLSQFLYCRDMEHFIKSKRRKRKRMSSLFDSSDEEDLTVKKSKLNLDNSGNSSTANSNLGKENLSTSIHPYLYILDMTSVLDSFHLSSNLEPIPGLGYKPRDSLCLEENKEEVFWTEKNFSETLSEEIMSLSTKVFRQKCGEKETEERKLSFLSPSWEEVRWRKSQEEASRELAVLVPLSNGRDKRNIHVDYLPALRNICRIEDSRSACNAKRKNRFQHYLSNLGVKLTNENLEINCDIFRL